MEDLKMRSVLFRDGEFEEYLHLKEALVEADVELDDQMLALLDETCVLVVAMVGGGEPSDAAIRDLREYPRKHWRALGIASTAMFQTLDSRNPVLALDDGDRIVMVVMPVEKLVTFLEGFFGKKIVLPPPNHPDLRWIASIAADGELLCTKQALSFRPNVGKA